MNAERNLLLLHINQMATAFCSAVFHGVCRKRVLMNASMLSEDIQERIGDLEDLCIAEQRLIETRAGHSKTYTLEEVEQYLGFADSV